MIQRKEKICKKGSGPALGFIGCGNPAFLYRYGLCSDCFISFLYNTPQGNEVRLKWLKSGKKQIAKSDRKEQAVKKEENRDKTYFEKLLEKLVNSIVRFIDSEKGCVSCDHGWEKPWTRQRHAGHRISVGSNATLRFNLFNEWVQCSICNDWKSANEREYDKGIIKHYGQEMLDYIKQLPAEYPELHLSIDELKDAISKAREVKKEILDGKDFTREEINKIIGIYKS